MIQHAEKAGGEKSEQTYGIYCSKCLPATIITFLIIIILIYFFLLGIKLI